MIKPPKQPFHDLTETVSISFEKLYLHFEKARMKNQVNIFVNDYFRMSFSSYFSDERFAYFIRTEQKMYQEYIVVRIFLPAILDKFSNKTKSKIKIADNRELSALSVCEFTFTNNNDILLQRFKQVHPNNDLKTYHLNWDFFNNPEVKTPDEEIGEQVKILFDQILIDLV